MMRREDFKHDLESTTSNGHPLSDDYIQGALFGWDTLADIVNALRSDYTEASTRRRQVAESLTRSVCGMGPPEIQMQTLLNLEPDPADREPIRALLEDGWESDVAGAFCRAADKHYNIVR